MNLPNLSESHGARHYTYRAYPRGVCYHAGGSGDARKIVKSASVSKGKQKPEHAERAPHNWCRAAIIPGCAGKEYKRSARPNKVKHAEVCTAYLMPAFDVIPELITPNINHHRTKVWCTHPSIAWSTSVGLTSWRKGLGSKAVLRPSEPPRRDKNIDADALNISSQPSVVLFAWKLTPTIAKVIVSGNSMNEQKAFEVSADLCQPQTVEIKYLEMPKEKLRPWSVHLICNSLMSVNV